MSARTTASAQLQHTAETLAAQIETGAFDALSQAERCDLRMLPMVLAGLADRVATVEGERDGLLAVTEVQRRVLKSEAVRLRWLVGIGALAPMIILLWRVI